MLGDDRAQRVARALEVAAQRERERVTGPRGNRCGVDRERTLEGSPRIVGSTRARGKVAEVDRRVGAHCGSSSSARASAACASSPRAEPRQGDPAVVVRLRVVGLERAGPVERGERLAGPARLQQRESEVVVGDGVAGRDTRGAGQA